LIPCYKGMDAYELPQELAELQSQDMGRLGFMQDLVRGVEKILGQGRRSGGEPERTNSSNPEVVGWLKRAWLFLEDGDFESATEYAERVLDRDPEVGEAYWIKAMAGWRVGGEGELAGRMELLSGNTDYQKALRFGSGDLKRHLEGIEQGIRGRLAEALRIKEQEEEQERLAKKKRAREIAEERERAEQARLRAETEERQRQQSVLARVRELVANGYLKEASELYGGLKKRLSGLDYRGAELALNHAMGEAARLESCLKAAISELQAAAVGVRGVPAFPPLGHRNKCRVARAAASAAMAEALRYVSSNGGTSGQEVGLLLETARELDRQVSDVGTRTGRLVKLLGSFWLAVTVASAVMLVQRQARQERERQRIAAEAKAAEEREMSEAKAAAQRAVAAAQAKVEAEEREWPRKAAEAKARIASGEIFTAGERLVLGLPVRWIPAGSFTMGGRLEWEGFVWNFTPHDVQLSQGFFLAETECTQAQWNAIMGSNPSSFKGLDLPVEQVSWEGAVEYCRKLTEKQRGEGTLPEGWQWRLPTEAEWEYAARAGTTGPRYGELDAIAWYRGNPGAQTHPVKQKTANGWGLYDVIGNVCEWCSDWFGDYSTKSVTDPIGPIKGSGRVFRGGSWDEGARSARADVRAGQEPSFRYQGLGFRPALSSVR
jgi:formylglycine-generating enzyme required for sulfatase activity